VYITQGLETEGKTKMSDDCWSEVSAVALSYRSTELKHGITTEMN